MADTHLLEYLPILLFFGAALFVSCAAVALSFILGKRKPDPAKEAAYECGFEAFGDARAPFGVKFYLVAILFLLFDLEIAFLFPWAIVLKEIGWAGFGAMMVFLSILTVGFVYEWKKGALEWE